MKFTGGIGCPYKEKEGQIVSAEERVLGKAGENCREVTLKQGYEGTMLMCGKRLQAV